MGLFNNPEKLDALVINNWPGEWEGLDVESENARGSNDPFEACAEDLAVRAKILQIPVVLGISKSAKWGEDKWIGCIRAAWPVGMSVDAMHKALFTWEILHDKHQLGSVSFGGWGKIDSPEKAIEFCNHIRGDTGKIWRCNFKIKPT